MLQIFDKSTWFLLLSAVNILPVLFYVAEDLRTFQTLLNHFESFWALTLNIPSQLFVTTKNKLKWLMLVWIWIALIIVVAFQTSMFGSLLKPRFEKSINTIKDLKESGRDIFIHKYFMENEEFIGKASILKKQFIPSNYTENIRRMKMKGNGAYCVSEEIANMIINHYIHTIGDSVYRKMQEILVTGLRMFHMQKNSPFLLKVNEILLKLEQFGLRREIQYPVYPKQQQGSKVLNLSHLSFVFIMYLWGNVIAILVFIFEVLWTRFRNVHRPKTFLANSESQ